MYGLPVSHLLPCNPSRAFDGGHPEFKPYIELATAVNKLEFVDTVFQDEKKTFYQDIV